MDESIGSEMAEWLISIETDRRSRLFSFERETPSKFMEMLCEQINAILQNKKEITDLCWQD